MTISAFVLEDSLAENGSRLTTFILKYPRMVHAEFLTHRQPSRNAASSRAIPVERMIRMVEQDPALPHFWGKNQKGMQAREELTGWRRWAAEKSWRFFVRLSTYEARWLSWLGLHKQLANRWTEPGGHITVICSATSYSNFLHLRAHKAAQPEIQELAYQMRDALARSTPKLLTAREWHTPFIRDEDRKDVVHYVESLPQEDWTPKILGPLESVFTLSTPDGAAKMALLLISVGRCARVSYLTHDGSRNIVDDIRLSHRLIEGLKTGEPLHISPFEHVARPFVYAASRSGNFSGWQQLRSFIPGEAGPDSDPYERLAHI